MRFKQIPTQSIRKKYRNYSPSALTNAYKHVKEHKVSVLKAAHIYQVPENTLRDRVNGKVDAENVTMGGVPLLDQYEEAKLVEHFKKMADFGYGYTRQECVDVATEHAIKLGIRNKDKPLSMRWMKGFLSRWPEMRVIKPRGLEHTRAKMASVDTVSNYFDNLEECIRKYGLEDKPHLIYNLDEKGISIDHKPPYIVAGTTHSAQAVTSGKGKTVTVLGCGSASGTAVPLFFVFPGKRMNRDLLIGASPGADGTMSESGWSNSEVFRQYLASHFMKFVPGRCDEKILIIVDGHRSHTAIGLSEWAEQNNIILFILPAHTSHLTQPLDVSCYGPFERMYNTQCHKVIRETSAAITRYNMCEIACRVYSRALSPENLMSGFKKTGIFPPNRYAISHEDLLPSEVFIARPCNDDSCDSDETVEGGRRIEPEINIFEKKELKLKAVKSEPKKPRNTVSKIVSGKELTCEKVQAALTQHEQQQKTPKRLPKDNKTQNKDKSCKKRKLKCQVVASRSPQPGPSHINIQDTSPESSEDEMSDSEKCCECGMYTPAQLANCVSIVFTKWWNEK